MSFDYLVQETKELINTKKAPGFIVGLSGIDSVLSFLIVAEAFKQLGAPNRVVGIHYAINDRLGWFESQVIPWLHRKCPEAKIVITELQYQDDYIRWGHLMSQSVIQNCWAVGSLNATEEYLGTYSNAMFMVSYLPLVGLYKTQIRELCKELQVPDVALVRSMMPDCECGRDQIESGFLRLQTP